MHPENGFVSLSTFRRLKHFLDQTASCLNEMRIVMLMPFIAALARTNTKRSTIDQAQTYCLTQTYCPSCGDVREQQKVGTKKQRMEETIASLAAWPTSKVPVVMKRYTKTFFCYPMRKARSVAWASTAGFHLREISESCRHVQVFVV